MSAPKDPNDKKNPAGRVRHDAGGRAIWGPHSPPRITLKARVFGFGALGAKDPWRSAMRAMAVRC